LRSTSERDRHRGSASIEFVLDELAKDIGYIVARDELIDNASAQVREAVLDSLSDFAAEEKVPPMNNGQCVHIMPAPPKMHSSFLGG
jgi:hypothetical protein